MSDNIPNSVATEIRILVSVLTKHSRRALEQRLGSYCPGVSGLQYRVLRALSTEEQTISKLSRRLMRSPSTFVPAIDALEQKGFIRRGQDPHDRRRTPLSLTARGARLLEEVPFLDEGDPLIQALSAMGDERARQLLTLLRELAHHFPDGDGIVSGVASRVHMHTACTA